MTEPDSAIQLSVEVLSPKLNTSEIHVKVAEIEDLFKSRFIPTDRANQCFKWLDELRLLRQCGRAIGPRSVGKTKALLHYKLEDEKRVSYVKALSNCSSRTIFSQILKDIGHAAHRGNRQDMRPRLAGCLQIFGIELLIVDEAENLHREALTDLKQVHEESGVPIVLAGQYILDNVLEEYGCRFYYPNLFEFDPLDEADLLRTLRAIERKILALPQASNLSEGMLFEILVASTGARIGVLVEILTQAVLYSLREGHGKVDERVLLNIANQYGIRYIPPEQRA